MTHHTIEHEGNQVVDIRGTCGSDECPIEDVDEDDGSIEYRCPVSGETLIDVPAVDSPDTPADRKPEPIDDIVGRRQRRNRRRR